LFKLLKKSAGICRNLEPDVSPSLTLFSLIALEKFTQTSENKAKIR
jgi:hypothetical protein